MVAYHVTLNGQGYVLDLDRYTRRIRPPFAPKQSAGSVAVGDLRGPEQVLSISDWSGGEGYVQHEDGRFRSGTGIDGYSVPGSLRIGPHVSVVGTTAKDNVRALRAYKGKLYAACAGGAVHSWDGSTFGNPHNVAGSPDLVCADVYLNDLYIGNSANDDGLNFDGTTWAKAFDAGAAVISMATHYREAAQYLYLGLKAGGAGGIGRIKFWDDSAISLGQFDTEEPDPTVMVVLDDQLYFVGVDTTTGTWALYSVDATTAGGQYRRFRLTPGQGQPISACVHRELAFLGDLSGGRLYSWDGDSLKLAAQVGTGAVAPSSWRGAVWSGYLDGTLGVFRRGDDGSIFRVASGLAGSDWRCSAVFLDRLYLGSVQTGAAKLFRVDPTVYGSSGVLTSGLITFGLPGVSKLLRSVTIVCAPMPSGHSIQVEYQLEDAGSWTSLGTLSTNGATTATYSFAANTTCRQVAFRVTLTGSAGSSSSPVLYELAVRYVPRPAITREWELAVILEGTAELPLITLDGDDEPLTGAQLTAALWTAAGSAGPVTLVDLDGASYSVYVDDVREEIAQISQRRGYQRVGLVKLVEAA